MGGSVAKTMNDNMEKNSQRMLNNQKELMMKQRQAQLAVQFATGRERLLWQGVLCSIVFPLLTVKAIKTKTPSAAIPILPLSFLFAYQYDMFYGDKMFRIRKDAEYLIQNEPDRFFLPKGNLILSQEEYNQMLNITKISEKKN